MTFEVNAQFVTILIMLLGLAVSAASLAVVVIMAMLGFLIRSILGLNKMLGGLREDVVKLNGVSDTTKESLLIIRNSLKDLYDKYNPLTVQVAKIEASMPPKVGKSE